MSHLWIREVLLDIAFYATANGLAQVSAEASRLALTLSVESDLSGPFHPAARAACNIVHMADHRQMRAHSGPPIPE